MERSSDPYESQEFSFATVLYKLRYKTVGEMCVKQAAWLYGERIGFAVVGNDICAIQTKTY